MLNSGACNFGAGSFALASKLLASKMHILDVFEEICDSGVVRMSDVFDAANAGSSCKTSCTDADTLCASNAISNASESTQTAAPIVTPSFCTSSPQPSKDSAASRVMHSAAENDCSHSLANTAFAGAPAFSDCTESVASRHQPSSIASTSAKHALDDASPPAVKRLLADCMSKSTISLADSKATPPLQMKTPPPVAATFKSTQLSGGGVPVDSMTRRKIKNRESAQIWREKRKKRLESLECENEVLQQQNAAMLERLERLEKANGALLQQIGDLQRQNRFAAQLFAEDLLVAPEASEEDALQLPLFDDAAFDVWNSNVFADESHSDWSEVAAGEMSKSVHVIAALREARHGENRARPSEDIFGKPDALAGGLQRRSAAQLPSSNRRLLLRRDGAPLIPLADAAKHRLSVDSPSAASSRLLVAGRRVCIGPLSSLQSRCLRMLAGAMLRRVLLLCKTLAWITTLVSSMCLCAASVPPFNSNQQPQSSPNKQRDPMIFFYWLLCVCSLSPPPHCYCYCSDSTPFCAEIALPAVWRCLFLRASCHSETFAQ